MKSSNNIAIINRMSNYNTRNNEGRGSKPPNRNGYQQNDNNQNGSYRGNRRRNERPPPKIDQTLFDFTTLKKSLVERDNLWCSKEVFDMECKKFDDMCIPNGLKENLLRGIYNYGYTDPSDIQSLAIPQITSGKNILAQSQSGTGKTGAFIISILQNIDETKKYTQCIILSPTCELANQTYTVGRALAQYMPNVKFSFSVGGINRNENLNELETSQIIIATPGRLLDLLLSNMRLFSKVKQLVIDECDELMSERFQSEVSRIIQNLPENLQICLFSATLTTQIIEVADVITKSNNNNNNTDLTVEPNYVKILVDKENVTLEGITQTYIEVSNSNMKNSVLIDMLGSLPIQQMIIYVNRKETGEMVKAILEKEDFEVLTISSNNTKYERANIISEFKKGHVKCLISTDLLSRGIDIQQLSLVINYDMPDSENIQCYIHRIGRSGRFGKKGFSINLVDERGKQIQNLIEMTFGCTIKPLTEDFSKNI